MTRAEAKTIALKSIYRRNFVGCVSWCVTPLSNVDLYTHRLTVFDAIATAASFIRSQGGTGLYENMRLHIGTSWAHVIATLPSFRVEGIVPAFTGTINGLTVVWNRRFESTDAWICEGGLAVRLWMTVANT